MGESSYLPREKLRDRGVAALSDTDLVAVILGAGIEGRPVKRVASAVVRAIGKGIQRENSLEDWDDFAEIEGVGMVKAMQVVCALELGRRVHGRDAQKRVIRSRSDVMGMFTYLKKKKQEHVVVVALNARNELLGRKTVAIGTLNKSLIEPRDIFSWALGVNAAGIILVHNHPSGNRTESPADKKFTERIREASALLGLELIDHVIV
jgi:DNA repair protein RadC